MKELVTSQGLGEEVSNIHVSANVLHFNVLTFDVLSNSKVTNVKMFGTLRGTLRVVDGLSSAKVVIEELKRVKFKFFIRSITFLMCWLSCSFRRGKSNT